MIILKLVIEYNIIMNGSLRRLEDFDGTDGVVNKKWDISRLIEKKDVDLGIYQAKEKFSPSELSLFFKSYNKKGRGLYNSGNTCYMNGALQCLSNSADLTYFMLSNKFKEEVNETNANSSGNLFY
jgi:ubiquitin C-terminal hydrolase